MEDKKELVLKEIEELPDPLIEDLLNYVQFLKMKLGQEKLGTLLLSESALKKDWLKTAEEEAWQDL